MGYSHRFQQQRDVTPEEWSRIESDFRTLVDAGALPVIQRARDLPEPPQIDGQHIRFNGVGDNGYETLVLKRQAGGHQFCKTDRRPYDTAVTALLILANHHAPGAWRIESDGTPADWEHGLYLVRTILELDTAIPDTLTA